jgi:hypothetical protein
MAGFGESNDKTEWKPWGDNRMLSSIFYATYVNDVSPIAEQLIKKLTAAGRKTKWQL